jgi:peptidylprolyl isomerase
MILQRYGTTLTLLALTATATAQTATTPKKPANPSATAAPAITAKPLVTVAGEASCSKLPDLSPKIPALPAGLSCARPLYTIVTNPQARIGYADPIASVEDINKYLGIEPASITLSYVDIQSGTGDLATPHKWFKVHYTGYLVDGTKFDSSLDRNEPLVLHYGEHQVIPGWDTGFAGMRVGGKRRLFIPYQLAYGPQGKPPVIPPNSELIFDIELVAQSDTDPTPKPAPAPAAPSDKPATPDSTKPETSPKPQGL